MITRPRRQKKPSYAPVSIKRIFYFFCAHRQHGIELATHVEKPHQAFLATNVTAYNKHLNVCRLENVQ